MRLNTMITLGASIAFGLGGVLLARGWINSAIEDEFRYVAPTTAESVTELAQINTVPVLIANVDLVFGDVLSRDAVRVVNYPEDAVPNGSFSNIETIFSSGDDRIVLSPLALNEPILDHKITGSAGKASLSARITSGYRAISIRVDDVSGVAGFVVPGDVVDIIYTREPEAKNGSAKSAASTYISDVILQNVTVLGVNQNQSQATSDANVARTVTLEVSNADGQALNLAMKQGTLSLSLRAVGETVPAQNHQMKLSDVGQKKTRTKTPTRSRNFVKKVVKKSPTNVSQVTVIRLRDNETETVERLDVKREQTSETTANETTTNQLSELAGG